MVRRRGAGEHAARDHSKAERRDPRGARRSRCQGTRAFGGRGAACHFTRGVRGVHPRGNEEVGRSGPRRGDQTPMTKTPVIDVHTHMLTNEWVALLEKHGGPSYTLKTVSGGLRAIHLDGAPFMTPVPNMFDWEARIANMDKAGVDIAVTSLT